MAKLAFDGVATPMALIVNECAGHNAEAVGRAEVATVASDLAQFIQDGEHLPGQ